MTHLAMIQRGVWYQVTSKASQLTWDIQGGSSARSAKLITYPAESAGPSPNQLFQFLELDEGRYAIAAMHSGHVLDVQGSSLTRDLENPDDPDDPIAHVLQFPFHGGDNQRFAAEDGGEGYVYFLAKHSRMAITEFNLRVGRRVGQNRFVRGSLSQLWKLHPIGATIPLPVLPKRQVLVDSPKLTRGNAPLEYPASKALTHATRVPCVCVEDALPMVERLRVSPYYLMVRKQYWKLKASETLQNERIYSSKRTWSESESAELTRKIGITVGADLGFRFNVISAGIKTTVSSELGVKSTAEVQASQTEQYTKTLRPRRPGANWYLYVRCNHFEVMRADGTEVASADGLEEWDFTRELQNPTGSVRKSRLTTLPSRS